MGTTGFGIDLVEELRAGRLPRAYGMERVVDALWETVRRPAGSRSAVLLGPSGAGKSAAVAELVHRLVEREPGAEWRVLRLGGGDFLRGTKYLGEWETRAMALIDEAKRPAKVILHVPDVAVLHSVGKAEKSDSNVAAVFAPFLETGEVSIVGEATPEEFAAGLGSVPSLRRPFQPITVEPTGAAETLAIVVRVAEGLVAEDSAGELFESVEPDCDPLPKATLERVVDLADLYGSSVAQPARSIELLRRALEGCSERPLEPRHVLDALSRTSGLPTELLDDDQPLDLSRLADFFARRVMGQPEAIEAVRDLVRFPELRFLDRFDTLVPILTGTA
ncbi:MAG: AAA family ATPase, partial [Planctomycetota bacterium]